MALLQLGPQSTIEDCQFALETARFEHEYEKTLGHAAGLLNAEKGRVLRMEQLLLQFENDSLRLRFDQLNENLATSTITETDTRIKLNVACQEIERLQGIANASSHEAGELRRELASLNETAIESKQLLSEKFRLAKDLSKAQSELERLSSQSTSSKSLSAEKQGLERQLNALEVQLENEKRAHERTQEKVSTQTEEIANLSAKLEQTCKDLAEEARARERQERDAHQQSVEWATQRIALEGKLEAANNRLKSTKDRLQEAQRDAQQRRSNARDNESSDSGPKTRTVPLHRPNRQFHPDMTIATPGAVKTNNKIMKTSTLPGDKSAFSITPFLSRTNGPADSPISSGDDMDELHAVTLNEDGRTSFPKDSDVAGNQATESRLQNPSNPKDKSRHADKQSPRLFKPTGLLKTANLNGPDHADDESQPESLGALLSDQGQAKMKRRKLGAHRERNLFDDEDEEGGKDQFSLRDTRKPGRKLALGVGRGLQVPDTGVGARLPASRGVAGPGFSPLKRDRKRF